VARKTSAKRLIDSLEGEASAKQQLQAVLDVLAEKKTVGQACAELDVSEATFHRLRDKVLAAAIEALIPRAAGRPPKPNETIPQVEELKKRLLETRMELEASRVREEIALVIPHLLKRPEEKKKMKRGPAREIFDRPAGMTSSSD
jgi:winged helix-turn helix protein